MRVYFVFIGISMLILAFGCKKSVELDTDYIALFTGNVDVKVSLTNVALKASFKGISAENFEKCGFEWSERNGDKAVLFSIGKPTSTEMSLQIDTALRTSSSYKIRAWIKAGNKVFYSGYSYFSGMGYPDPEITSLSKRYAYWGETVYINGRYFDENYSGYLIKVKINNIPCQVISSSNVKIGIVMPYIEASGDVIIELSVPGKAIQETVVYNYRPEVTSVSPQAISLNGEITIKGKFHSEYRDIIVPVQKGADNYYYPEYSIVKYSDDEIILKRGTYMYCDTLYQIYFRLKQYDYDDYKYLNTSFNVRRTGNWVRLNNTPFNSLDKAIACNGMGYLIQFKNYTSNFPFWRYDPQSDKWEKMAPFPGKSRIDPVFVECNGYIYCGLGKINNTFYELMTDFWKYDPAVNKWSQCANLNFK